MTPLSSLPNLQSLNARLSDSSPPSETSFPDSQSQQILVLGGGLMGTAIALELRLRGCQVRVLSRDRQEAAGYAAAGMLAPQAEKLTGPMLELCLRSRDLYPSWVSKLESLTGQPTGYWASGILNPVYALPEQQPAHPNPDEKAPAIWLNRAEIEAQQPGLGADVVGGWWFPKDAQIDNRRQLLSVLHQAIAQTGVQWEEGVSIEQIEVESIESDLTGESALTGESTPAGARQIQAIHTSQGVRRADHYVLATGAWSGSVPGLELPVYPRKGQLLSLRARGQDHEAMGQPLGQVLYGDRIYIVPRQDGLIVVGATVEDVAFAPGNTAAGIQTLLNEAIRLYPPLQDFELVETWWGYRPATPDELPILGPSPLHNLTLATGHYRNGILLTPITAQLVADSIVDIAGAGIPSVTRTSARASQQTKTDPLLTAFQWDRFGLRN